MKRLAPKRVITPAIRRRRAGDRRFVILSGLSGSGKTHAIRALEDLGYFCIDNLPTLMLPTLAELSMRNDAGLDKVAIVVDVREAVSYTHLTLPTILRV